LFSCKIQTVPGAQRVSAVNGTRQSPVVSNIQPELSHRLFRTAGRHFRADLTAQKKIKKVLPENKSKKTRLASMVHRPIPRKGPPIKANINGVKN